MSILDIYCDQIKSQCVLYTGPDIPCLEITTGMTMNVVFDILSEALINCCSTPCEVSEWSAWSNCNTSTGTRTRTRTITVQPIGCQGGCPPLTETENCAVNCVVSAWSDWSVCENGTQTRTRTVVTPALNGGTPCGDLVDTRACTTTTTTSTTTTTTTTIAPTTTTTTTTTQAPVVGTPILLCYSNATVQDACCGCIPATTTTTSTTSTTTTEAPPTTSTTTSTTTTSTPIPVLTAGTCTVGSPSGQITINGGTNGDTVKVKIYYAGYVGTNGASTSVSAYAYLDGVGPTRVCYPANSGSYSFILTMEVPITLTGSTVTLPTTFYYRNGTSFSLYNKYVQIVEYNGVRVNGPQLSSVCSGNDAGPGC